MTKEAWKTARVITVGTVFGATEGALISSVLPIPGVPVIGALYGGITGGIAALATASSAEALGHIAKRTITSRENVSLKFTETTGATTTVTTEVTETQKDVPIIRIPDAALQTQFDAFNRATGDVTRFQARLLVTKGTPDESTIQHSRPMNLRFAKSK